MAEALAQPPAYLPEGMTYGTITDTIAQAVAARPGWRWWAAVAASFGLTIVMLVAIGWLFWRGLGIWGNNADVVWGFAITNYVWWIGIGNAGTLISSMLLLTRQRWRASINRFAEAMTLFAACIAGLFPILHLGRPYLFYWLVPYPNVMGVWPQWRSPLVWDLFAIASYIIFSALFWYTGLLPDLATLRDRATTRFGQLCYGTVALGWRGSARQWQRLESYYWAMAAMAVPLVVSVHSVVGLDFAAGVMPGWHETIFPPYFVVGAMFSGFAMVVTLAIPIRWGLRLQSLITLDHFDVIGRILVMGSLIMGASYATEWFMSWYAGDRADRSLTVFQFAGHYAPFFWCLLLCNVALPQLLWWRRVRRTLWALLAIALAINLGMWLERILIILNTLSHAYVPAQWSTYAPTLWDWALLAGTLGFFAFLFLIFVRLVPTVSMHEVRQLAHAEAAAAQAPYPPKPVPRPHDGAAPGRLLAEFGTPEALHAAVGRARSAGYRRLEAYAPFALDGLAEALAVRPARLRPTMLVGAVAGALTGIGLQYWTAVHAYPIDSGGRPLASWPAFVPVIFELAVLFAALAGFVAFLVGAGLPRPHHPVFGVPGFERATRDRFFLEIAPEPGEEHAGALLETLDPVAVHEVRT